MEGREAGAELSEWKQEDHQAGPGPGRQSHQSLHDKVVLILLIKTGRFHMIDNKLKS